MQTKFLLITSWYNNKITDDIIKEYKNKILFSFCDYYTLKYFKEKYNIKKYYTIFSIDDSIDIINLYYTKKSLCIYKNINLPKNTLNKVLIINGYKNQKLSWLDFISYKKIFMLNINNEWNIPNEKNNKLSTKTFNNRNSF